MTSHVSHLGDDLDQARLFVTSAMSNMDLLLTDIRLDKTSAVITVSLIQTSAKDMQARGIYRAALSVVESYENHHQQPKIDGRLMALYKLVVQYSDGLDEIAPEITTVAEVQPQRDNLNLSAQQNYDISKTTLTELLPLAGDHSEALNRLMNLDMGAKPEITPQTSFESLMPEVTDAALRSARGQGKSVSISYAAENLFIENSQVEQVRGELDRIVERLVRGKIGTPEQRQNAGLPRSGHIDVSATQGPEGLNISVLCEGETIDFTRPAMDEKLQGVGT